MNARFAGFGRAASAISQTSAPTALATPRSTPVEDLVFGILGLLVVSALYADGRAHILGLPDSFFTPWHALLYGGLLLTVAWLAVMSRRAATRAGGNRIIAIPAGYGYAFAGAALFAIGGVADMVWHLVFGVEFGIDALLSPSHLLLFVGGSLLLSGPLLAFRRRNASATPIMERIPGLLALIGITGVAAFALSFLSAFITDAPTIPVAHEPEGTEAHMVAEGLASAGLGSFIVTSLLIAIPAVYMVRIRLWFPGAFSVLVTVIAALASALVGFQNITSVMAAFLSAAVLDAIVLGLHSRITARAVELVVAAGLPLLVWPGQLIALSTQTSLGWSEEMISGVVAVSALVSFAVVLAVGARRAAD